ncbi:complex I subunit 5 family protein [Rubrobacter indicoceani]|uniref:complex I subunit 5 family protein n=1 Tax=Rubrobacter indicoceani TaxID=2051957 RepID=UPI0019699079|nr:proton-conducting transporter membrane subunit [Rubrobacter indicoceani]
MAAPGTSLAILLPVLLPLVGATVAFLAGGASLKTGRRVQVGTGLLTAAGVLGSVVLLWSVVAAEGPVSYQLAGWEVPVGIALRADGLSVLMLLTTALVGGFGSIYAVGYFSSNNEDRRTGREVEGFRDPGRSFWPLWLFLWAALNGLFLSGDAFNLYVTLELLGLSAAALISLGGTGSALAAGMRYLMVSLLGSLAYLLGVALLYGAFGVLDISLLGENASSVPATWAALAFISLGMALKTGLFPLHFWLPSAYSASPSVASALLAALVGKASFYILLRLWFDVFEGSVPAVSGQLLGAFGAVAILWGAIMAVRQRRLKLLLAYSSVSQIGYLFLVFALVTGGGRGFDAWAGASYLVLAHASAKAAMFMAAGAIIFALGHDDIDRLRGIAQKLPIPVASFAIAGITIMGLPTSGGFTAKWLLLSSSLSSGQWWYGGVILAGGVLAAVYLLRFLNPALIQVKTSPVLRIPPKSMSVSAFMLALISLALGLVSAPLLDLLAVGAPFQPEVPGE